MIVSWLVKWLKCRLNVRRGAKFLDKKYPGWYDKLATQELTMESIYLDVDSFMHCVVGTLYGNYLKGLDILMIDSAEEAYHYGVYSEDVLDEVPLLNLFWKKEILKRARKNR